MRVLIVEDNENMRTILRRYFEDMACEVVCASNLDEAIAMIHDAQPVNLVSLDLNLGPGGPAATLGRIKDLKKLYPDAVLIVFSGVVDEKQTADVLAAGADGFIQKLSAPTRLTFIGRVRDVLIGLVSNPGPSVRNLALVESMATRFTDYVKRETQA